MALLQVLLEILRYECSLFPYNNEKFVGYLTPVTAALGENNKWVNQKELQ